FYNEDEPGMVNAVLDHIARESRLDELGAKRA
ncbi:MAG: transcription antitermination factor NusB, partial [Proteobacteria bacterium]|nr:transcription antitermination factor NusB [Pseudomonadota bacterium]